MFPNSIVFCNAESEILSITQTYNDYKWYKQQWSWRVPNPNPWTLITGATSPTLTINGGTDKLFYFKVQVTQNGCTAESSAVLVDGYAYDTPVMITTLTPGTYEEVTPGEYNVCQGASVLFEDCFPAVYGTHIWFKCAPGSMPPVSGDPCILTRITGDSYTAYESGEYTFYACTEYCPDQCIYQGFSTKLNFGEWSFCTLGTDEAKSKKIA